MSLSPSRLEQLRHTNQVPSDEEVEDILELVAASQNHIKSYTIDVSVDLADDASDKLHSRLKAIRDFTQHQQLLSPARRIPQEIIAEIISHIIDEGDDSLAGAHCLPFTQVCRLWRAAFRPLLPSAGTFLCPRGTITSSSRIKDIVQAFNSFLDSLPSPSSRFSLIIRDTLTRGDVPATGVRSTLMDGFLVHADRIFSLQLSLDPSVFAELHQRLTNQLDNLLILKLTISGTLGAYAGSLNAFESAKSLQLIELISPMKILIKLPINQLVSYKEHSLGSGIMVGHVLQHAPNLKCLEHTAHTRIAHPYYLSQWSEKPKALKALSLMTYNMGDQYSRYVDYEWTEDGPLQRDPDFFIPCFRLPNVEEIRIRDPDRNAIPGLIHLLKFSSPCGGSFLSLTKLVICGLRYHPLQLHKLLTLTPNLTYLEYNDIVNQYMEFLGILSQKPLAVNRLDTLIIHNAHKASSVQDFVVSRWEAFSASECERLVTVKLLYRDPQNALRMGAGLGLPPIDRGDLDVLVQSLEGLTGRFIKLTKKKSGSLEVSSFFRRSATISAQEEERKAQEVLVQLMNISPLNVKLTYIHTLHSFSLAYRSAATQLEDWQSNATLTQISVAPGSRPLLVGCRRPSG
ncbi:hypothetical protein CVT24_011370 [Panaeolus cyanescens]|uniref:F-box domain-containing protein n=1 Tax=Panaeolus cyanescens TaxID=181874 RepID=A0A409YGR9_9AGAR|nr:hypothetical protein CVT24_011370 [Panaeolus cyanescens]